MVDVIARCAAARTSLEPDGKSTSEVEEDDVEEDDVEEADEEINVSVASASQQDPVAERMAYWPGH